MEFLSDVTVELVRHNAADSDVVWAARVSTAGEQSLEAVHQDPERSRGLINYLMRDRHGSPFEHNSMTFFISAPILVFREFHRHRVGWCLPGDALIPVGPLTNGVNKKIKDIYADWHEGVHDSVGGVRELPSRRHPTTRTVNLDTGLIESARIADVFRSGIKPILKITTVHGKVLRCSPDHALLSRGAWVKAKDLAPADLISAQATVPAGESTGVPGPLREGVRDEEILSVVPDGEEETYDISMPGPWHNFIADGIVVHNSYNEESGRYRELQPVFYVPGRERRLVQQGKPGKYTFVEGDDEQYKLVTEAMEDSYRRSYEAYQEMLKAGIAREVARAVLPVGLFSSMYATCNARSLMHFLSLRTKDERATVPSFPQREIEMVAEKMEAIWAGLMPLTYAAFNAAGRVAP
ncbi:FAD-dependent thymidylate synthase [Sphaerisporangium album]|uniref:Flavin-dependent thymidylate synthase n=1 Tax=Sphaerisporangium album TaxID=509200 RepID=A0A367FA49_9ACTN|nr:FAD-dependent thymidylate synthase [Sphaerisporangium album]RCG26799.1 FAD-dependent thymidylate synthase [Sphaerisporangium album]